MTEPDVIRPALDLLRLTRARIARGWTQRTNARDIEGRAVQKDDPTATCWCLGAAFWIEAGDNYGPVEQCACEAIDPYLQMDDWGGGPSKMIWFNDKIAKSKEDVIFALDAAIADLEHLLGQT